MSVSGKQLVNTTTSYLTHSTDAHVEGVRTAARSIQHFGGQFNSEAPSFGLTSQGAGGRGVVRCRDPLMSNTLVLDVIVG